MDALGKRRGSPNYHRKSIWRPKKWKSPSDYKFSDTISNLKVIDVKCKDGRSVFKVSPRRGRERKEELSNGEEFCAFPHPLTLPACHPGRKRIGRTDGWIRSLMRHFPRRATLSSLINKFRRRVIYAPVAQIIMAYFDCFCLYFVFTNIIASTNAPAPMQ